MRAFVLVVALALGTIVLYCAHIVATGMRDTSARRQRAQATWQVRHYSIGVTTVVAVSLLTPRDEVLDEHIVARLPVDDPDWQQRFAQAKQEAEQRATHLNT